MIGSPIILQTLGTSFSNPMVSFSLMTIVFALLLFGWVWSISIASNRQLPEEYRRSTKLFTSGFAFAGLYMFVSPYFVIPQPGVEPSLPLPIAIVHLASIYFLWTMVLCEAIHDTKAHGKGGCDRCIGAIFRNAVLPYRYLVH